MISPSQVQWLAQERHKELEQRAQHYREVKAAVRAHSKPSSEFRIWFGKQMVAMGERLQSPLHQTCSTRCTQADICATG